MIYITNNTCTQHNIVKETYDIYTFLVKLKHSIIMGNILYTIAVICIILWLVGFLGFGGFGLGNLIHVLLVIAVVVILFRVIKG